MNGNLSVRFVVEFFQVFVDRIVARAPGGGWNPTGGIVYCYDKAGRELWKTLPQGGITIASAATHTQCDAQRRFR